jgi:hypothetical protein
MRRRCFRRATRGLSARVCLRIAGCQGQGGAQASGRTLLALAVTGCRHAGDGLMGLTGWAAFIRPYSQQGNRIRASNRGSRIWMRAHLSRSPELGDLGKSPLFRGLLPGPAELGALLRSCAPDCLCSPFSLRIPPPGGSWCWPGLRYAPGAPTSASSGLRCNLRISAWRSPRYPAPYTSAFAR